jgi:hypothetical protein
MSGIYGEDNYGDDGFEEPDEDYEAIQVRWLASSLFS